MTEQSDYAALYQRLKTVTEERDTARAQAIALLAVLNQFPFDRCMRVVHLANRHMREWQ